MVASRFSASSFDLQLERDVIDVTSGLPSPDEQWRYTDRNGHVHFYEHGYPTLDYIVDASHWCDGTEGFALHDPHESVDESHYECRICREVIAPRLDPPFTPKSIAGAVTATLSGYRSDGTWIRAEVSEADARSIMYAEDQDAAALAVLDAAERIIEQRFVSR